MGTPLGGLPTIFRRQWRILPIKDDLVEAYVDDIVVKTKEAHTLVDNLECTFAALNTFSGN